MCGSREHVNYPVPTGIMRALRVYAALMLLSGCAHEIPLERTLGICPGQSPAAKAKGFYDEYYQAGCETSSKQVALPPDSYERTKKRIDTRQCFHDAVLAYHTYETADPLYLLGIEKPRHNADPPYVLSTKFPSDALLLAPTQFQGAAGDDEGEVRDTQEAISAALDDPRPLVLTHVLKVRTKGSSGTDTSGKECFVYNVYGDKNSAPWCTNYQTTNVDRPEWTQDGWNAMGQLGREIRAQLRRQAKTTELLPISFCWPRAGTRENMNHFWTFSNG